MSDRQARKQAVTQADVARHAGVSGAVVSYVVHGGPRPVAAETALRVRASIEALGYRPNASAAALRTGSSKLLGLVVPDIGNTLWADLTVAAGRCAADRGYDLITASSEGSATIERQHLQSLAGRQVEGLLVTVVDMVDPDVAGITGTGIPTVLLNVFSDAPGVSSIGVDARRGAADGVTHLLGHGYRDVGLIIHPDETVELREQGWEQALGSRGPIERGPSTRQGGYEAALRLFGRPDRPRSVFVSSDMQAIGCLRALWELGLRVPEDVAVVSFDGAADSAFTTPPLTVVRQPVGLMARQAVDLVLDGGPARRIVEPATLTVRKSCGC
ncbi:LacI family DNA-binding transcriptional regulator [Actinoplanes couchii]|uniref:LacI family transcriptional regulator n=1 Tax=Actinoplanes couchii TaxID=403638 RepID=A0ABQ3X821_9ACTN|nr:LacI family DNA-binding transcriptional regulator [Actinoplanes couchii]MDR6320355.1 LacI family transcriptional regulator [Actinoplanes couchii]GID54632.1 LacI family transcriptional regulator [Actinoplanes couchii]